LAGLDTSDWRTALTLYHGQPFAGFRCGEWLDEYIERMQLRLRNMLLRGLQHAERDGDGDSVTRLCEALLKDDPVCEPAWQALIRKATRRGDMTAARHLLEQCRTLMRRELGVDPAPETLRLLTEGGVA
jgi:DNA-binding SARP family transcriptional activator